MIRKVAMLFCTLMFSLTALAAQYPTPLMEAARTSDSRTVQALIDSGASVHDLDKNGRTALMYAARSNFRPEVINVLVAAGSEVNQTDVEGMTALLLVTSIQHKEHHKPVVDALIKAGADVNQMSNSGMTPLMWAAVHDQIYHVESLIASGADVNHSNKLMMTALMYAALPSEPSAKLRKTGVIIVLNAAGANKSLVNENGMTAYDIAVANKQWKEIVGLLKVK